MSDLRNRIEALITLLGDDDREVIEIARRELLNYGEAVMPFLKQFGQSDTEGLVRIRVQVLLEELRQQQLQRRFGDLLNQPVFDLELGSFLLAEVEYPDVNVPFYRGVLDEMAEEIQHRIAGMPDPLTQVEIINWYLYEEMGFRGNLKAYYDPENSYINRVLERHLGIPISLAAVYLFLADRLNLPIYGVSFPRHFLLKYWLENDLFYIDAFNKGRILTREDCENVLRRQGIAFEESYLECAPAVEIFVRMLRNLLLIYQHRDEMHKIATLEKVFSELFIKQEEDRNL